MELKSFLIPMCFAVILSSGVTIFAHYLRPKNPVPFYIFKPLTTLLILAVAIPPGIFLSNPYARAILFGLVFSLFGDIWLMLPGNRFLLGLVSFLIAHIGYIIAFLPGAEAGGFPWAAIPIALIAILLLAYLWPGLSARLKIPVGIYITIIVIMVTLAATGAIAHPSSPTLCAAAGALLFMASDATLAIDRFRRPFRLAQALILGSYYLGQLLIALSIGLRIGG